MEREKHPDWSGPIRNTSMELIGEFARLNLEVVKFASSNYLRATPELLRELRENAQFLYSLTKNVRDF